MKKKKKIIHSLTSAPLHTLDRDWFGCPDLTVTTIGCVLSARTLFSQLLSRWTAQPAKSCSLFLKKILALDSERHQQHRGDYWSHYSDDGRTWLMHLYNSTRTLVGPQRFISGSIGPSTPFERKLSFTSPSKRAADSQNCRRLSNTNAPVYLHWWAVSLALRSCSSEREKNCSNWLAQRLASLRNFGAVGVDDLGSHNWSVRNPDWSLIEAKCTLRMMCRAASSRQWAGQWNNGQWDSIHTHTHTPARFNDCEVFLQTISACSVLSRSCKLYQHKRQGQLEKEQIRQPFWTSCG